MYNDADLDGLLDYLRYAQESAPSMPRDLKDGDEVTINMDVKVYRDPSLNHSQITFRIPEDLDSLRSLYTVTEIEKRVYRLEPLLQLPLL